MNADQNLRRAQVYRFLANALSYPQENWLEDLPALQSILEELDTPFALPASIEIDLAGLQSEHRHTLGLSGSLSYETEIGLPNEFRQSQELADIAGFYRAFGFKVGGQVRERPDFLATELEFMCTLALKGALASQQGLGEQAEICLAAQRNFLQDHLGRWIGLFAGGLAVAAGLDEAYPDLDQPYLWLANLAADFVAADAVRLGVSLEPIPLWGVAPTPVGPALSCDGCLAAG